MSLAEDGDGCVFVRRSLHRRVMNRKFVGSGYREVAVMVLLGSTGLLDWANDLPVGTTIGDALSNLAQRWNDAMTYLHLTHFAEFLRQAWQAFQDLR